MADTDSWVQFCANPDLGQWLRGRQTRFVDYGGLSRRAQKELELWRLALRTEQARTQWTCAELGCLADVLNGSLIQPALGDTLALELSAAFTPAPGESYGAEWGVDQEALVAKVAALGPVAVHATADAMARFWEDSDIGDHTDPQMWRQLGFRVEDTN